MTQRPFTLAPRTLLAALRRRLQRPSPMERLQHIHTALSHASKSIVRAQGETQLLQDICHICVQSGHIELACVHLYEIVDQRPRLRVAAWAGKVAQPPEIGSLEFDLNVPANCHTLAGQALLHGVHAVSHNYQADARQQAACWHNPALTAGLSTMALFPLRRSAQVAGLLRLGTNQAVTFDTELLELFDTLAEDISFAFDNFAREAQRLQAMAQAQADKQRFEHLFNSTPVPTSIHCLPSMQVVALNAAASTVYGFAPDLLLGHTFQELGIGVVAEHTARVMLIIHSGQPGTLEIKVRVASGEIRDVLFQIAHLNYQDQPCVMLMAPDITEQKRIERELSDANDKLNRLSMTDGLTGIGNRRQFDLRLRDEWGRSARTQQPLSLLLMDIDHFKRYNDYHGHLQGDECLRNVTRLLGDCVHRAGELVARYGGEEFAILLPNTDLDHARTVAENCLARLQEAQIPHGDCPIAAHVTLSIGVASAVSIKGQTPDVLIALADRALYLAKHSGRNQLQAMV